MTEISPSRRREALETFGARLAAVRAEAGSPSFREMAARSGAISHTTLHDAVRGVRLPSWETVVEFAKACDVDPVSLRPDWERVSDAVRGRAHPDAGPEREALRDQASEPRTDPVAPTTAPAAGTPVEDPATTRPTGPLGTPPPPVEPHPSTSSVLAPSPPPTARSRLPLAVGGLVLAGAVVAGIGWAARRPAPPVASTAAQGSDPSVTPAQHVEPVPVTVTSPVASDCPVPGPDVPSTPRHAGDHARFVTDVTLPDCSRVPKDTTMAKTWRLQNTGTRPWVGYTLRRLDPSGGRRTCQTITDVPVPRTAPGGTVDITTAVTTPAEPTFCYVRFRLADERGDLAFSGGRPITFQLVVR